jgi:hypothetical protein
LSHELPVCHVCPEDFRKGHNDLFWLAESYTKIVLYGLSQDQGEHPLVLLPIHHRRYEVLRKHLRKLRGLAGLTQAELGARLKVGQSYVSKIERGERYIDVLFYVDWCRACKLVPEESLADLIRGGA